MLSRFSVALSLLSFVLLSTVLFDVSSASAASIYDDAIRQATPSDLYVQTPGKDKITLDPAHLLDFWFSQNTAGCITQKQSYLRALNTGSWAITVFDSGTNKQRIFINWSENHVTNVNFSKQFSPLRSIAETTNNTSGEIRSGVVLSQGSSGNLSVNCPSSLNGFSSPYVSSASPPPDDTSGFSVKVWITTFHLNYPPDYAGLKPSTSYTPKTDFYPEFEYAVSDRGIAITQFKRIPSGLNRFDVKLFKADDDYNIIGDPVDTDLEHLLYAGSNSYVEAPSYGKYVLDVYIYPPPGSPLLDDFDFKSAFIHLNIDGSTFTGTSYGENCINGSCSTPSIYEECDLIDIPCHFRNFWTGLRALFIVIFIPSSSDMSRLFNDANSFIHTKFGFLTYPFDWIYSLFGAMANSSAACNGVSLSGIPSVSPGDRFFGSPVNLNVCSAEHDFPKIYNIAVFFIRVVLVLAMVAAVYRKFLVTLGDHGSRYQDGRSEELYR